MFLTILHKNTFFCNIRNITFSEHVFSQKNACSQLHTKKQHFLTKKAPAASFTHNNANFQQKKAPAASFTRKKKIMKKNAWGFLTRPKVHFSHNKKTPAAMHTRKNVLFHQNSAYGHAHAKTYFFANRPGTTQDDWYRS